MRSTILEVAKRGFIGSLLLLAFVPGVAFAQSDETAYEADEVVEVAEEVADSSDKGNLGTSSLETILDKLSQAVSLQIAQVNKVLPYDRALITQVGTQASTGHSVCCPGFACAYGDVVIDGTVNSHAYYGCGNCNWADWGGGNSAYRSVNNVLREAYDQILAGKPTVIHVGASYGQHWITLIGYQDAYDSDNLTLSNFIALDPWDGSELVAGDCFRLYGDGCEHISTR